MTELNQQIMLSGSETYCTPSGKDAYRVDKGSVYVFIVEWVVDNGQERPGLRREICVASEGQMIPGFAFRDSDYNDWRFLITPKGEDAVLSQRTSSVTSVLQKKFLMRAGIDTYATEGFEGSLVEFYKRENLKKDVFIGRNVNLEPEAKEESFDTIRAAFLDNAASGLSGNDAYKALGFVCQVLQIPIIDSKEILTRCGKDPDIKDIARASRFICRSVVLDPEWYRNDCGGLIGKIDDEIVACVPYRSGKYKIYRTGDGSISRLTPELAKQISPQAYSIGRTLPPGKLTKKDVVRFCKKSITFRELGPIMLLALVCTLIGVLLPTLNRMIYDDYIPIGNIGSLAEIAIVMLSFMIGNIFFSIVKNLFDFRLTTRVGNDLQNALYHRMFHLSESFFRDYDSADLARRVMGVGNVASRITNALVITGLSSLLAIIYFVQMCGYSGKLSWIGCGMFLIYMLIVVWITSATRKKEALIAESEAEASSKLYQYLNGVDKIRMAGVEDRALLSYMKPYAEQQSHEIKMNRLLSAKEALGCVITSIFSMVLYLIITKSQIQLSIGAFVAFNTAFGSFTGAITGLAMELLGLYQEKEIITRFWPVFDTAPEDDDSKEIYDEIKGGIALDHVTFSYTEGGKNVLNDMSLRIKPGEYVGIVGSSGCGKSTLLKLLLGFETPKRGMVLIDDKDLKSMDKSVYRRQLGVVLQNGKLISGSIYENITITAPQTNMARVNEVIEQVGLKRDIDQMPMGIHTMLSETANTISGGQQQRILIARAIVGSPKILIFDEATSALDNLTQAAVSSNLDKMKVTRIVVAHRLSTIKNCDRILVLNDGSVVEEGNYDDLMAKKGLFYALASRQIAE